MVDSSTFFRGGRRWLFIGVAAVVSLLFLTHLRLPVQQWPSSLSKSTTTTKHHTVPDLLPQDLLARPLASNLELIPKLIHQSWSSAELPYKYKKWTHSRVSSNPDWEWVLWTDADNEELVKKHFSWFWDTYNKLPSPILKADVTRNLYMYMFGGMYADLDFEFLRPVDELFNKYNVSTIPHNSKLSETTELMTSGRKAFFGRMGTDENFSDSIPNAWMGATPGHPFFLLVIEELIASIEKNGASAPAEAVTGPKALRDDLTKYKTEADFKGDHIDKHFAANPAWKKFTRHTYTGLTHDAIILPFQYIYPYSWAGDGAAFRSFCWAKSDEFDADRCKSLVAVDRWPSYAITYWSHSWTNGGHDDDMVAKLNQPT